jgi:hypothetical protein
MADSALASRSVTGARWRPSAPGGSKAFEDSGKPLAELALRRREQSPPLHWIIRAVTFMDECPAGGQFVADDRDTASCETLYYGRKSITTRNVERETGIEPATSSLGSWRSTAELLPPGWRQSLETNQSLALDEGGDNRAARPQRYLFRSGLLRPVGSGIPQPEVSN